MITKEIAKLEGIRFYCIPKLRENFGFSIALMHYDLVYIIPNLK